MEQFNLHVHLSVPSACTFYIAPEVGCVLHSETCRANSVIKTALNNLHQAGPNKTYEGAYFVLALIEGLCEAILKLQPALSPVKEVAIPTGYEIKWNPGLILIVWRKEVFVCPFIREI